MPPDALELCRRLAELLRPRITPATALVGIHTGGVWVAEWLHRELGLKQPLGSMNVSFYRDDYHKRGLAAERKPSAIPFEVGDAHIILVDDVLHTGRTVRAALNELFDYGRPARVELAVLVDRGGRELPIEAAYCAHRLDLPPAQSMDLNRAADGTLSFSVVNR